MNDPWDVKSVRQSDQYISCMKINGVPLLPPVLSKECRKEMQYYKLLAREVEKRISILKPYVGSDSDSEDKTDAPELPEYEQTFELPVDGIETNFDIEIEKVSTIAKEKSVEQTLKLDEPCVVTTDVFNTVTSNVIVKTSDPPSIDSTKFVIDLSLSINETGTSLLDSKKKLPQVVKKQRSPPPVELPERDCDSPNKSPKVIQKELQKEFLTDVETNRKHVTKNLIKDVVNFNIGLGKESLTNAFAEIPINPDGPSSLSSKSFTGSLNDLHTESIKESQIVPKLIRQSSYTVLKPSPQLLAHLEVQSLNTGVEMSAISMSESLSNLSSPGKKRRSWDLESAKVKWSSMALELKRANLAGTMKPATNSVNNNNDQLNRAVTKKAQQAASPAKARAAAPDVKARRGSLNSKHLPKSDPIQKPKNNVTPVKNTISNRTIVKEPTSPRQLNQKKGNHSPKQSPPAISESEDPATRVRELYEKIQNQQLLQMASLVEKQKREQMLLQQVFEEQNNLLFKQLKTICPKSPVEAKSAWEDKVDDRGPVSLNQIISHKTPPSNISSPVSNTLTETNNCINRCDNVLKKSRDITSGIKKQPQAKSRSLNGTAKVQTPQLEGSRTRTHSPIQRNSSRKLNYDETSASSERECEPILTDRTNDTMADLHNITFPSDNSEELPYFNTLSSRCNKNPAMKNRDPNSISTDSAIRCLEDSIQHSMNTMIASPRAKQSMYLCPTPKERAAATTIVAYAKGYLVRRLMRTERVQGTVQTIRDALLCALQLHQDREGIRGADVDLHRRLIQQITAACYNLHDTFVASSPAERCAMIAADRGRRRSLAARQTPTPNSRHTDIMSQSHSGAFPTRNKRAPSTSLMTQSNYETFSGDKCGPGGGARARYMPSPRRRPWR